MTKRKVLLIVASDRIIGGHSVQAREIFNFFSDNPHIEMKRCDIDVNLPSFIRKLRVLRTIINTFLYVLILLQAVRWADVLHIFSASYWSFLLAPTPAIFLGRIFHKHIIVNYHSGEAGDHLEKWEIIVRPILRLAHELIVPSLYLQEVFFEHGYQTRVIPNTVDYRRFYRKVPTERDPLRILCTRNFEGHYRVDRVVLAFQKIKEKIPTAQLTLVGNGSLKTDLMELVSKRRLTDIFFPGQVHNNDIESFYHESNLYFNASAIDNLPISLLEAMAAGLITVSTAAGGIPYFLQHSVNGILVYSGEPESLANAVLDVYGDHEQWHNIQINAQQYAQQYVAENVCILWERLYLGLSQG